MKLNLNYLDNAVTDRELYLFVNDRNKRFIKISRYLKNCMRIWHRCRDFGGPRQAKFDTAINNFLTRMELDYFRDTCKMPVGALESFYQMVTSTQAKNCMALAFLRADTIEQVESRCSCSKMDWNDISNSCYQYFQVCIGSFNGTGLDIREERDRELEKESKSLYQEMFTICHKRPL